MRNSLRLKKEAVAAHEGEISRDMAKAQELIQAFNDELAEIEEGRKMDIASIDSAADTQRLVINSRAETYCARIKARIASLEAHLRDLDPPEEKPKRKPLTVVDTDKAQQPTGT